MLQKPLPGRLARPVRVAAAIAVLVASSCGGEAAKDSPAVTALRQQMKLASDGQFGRLWEVLHPAQQAVIPKEDFMFCSSKRGDVEVSLGSIKDEYTEEVGLPGTDVKADSVALTVEFVSGTSTTTSTMHEFEVDGEWRWAVADLDEYNPEFC